MRKHEIENWVLQIVDQVKVGQPNEDSRVELKTEYPEPKTAAWQIGDMLMLQRETQSYG